jgi:hypothetical protein
MPTGFEWPDGKRCAVSITYDDGLRCHVDFVAALLESRGLRGTFYANIQSDIMQRPELWGSLAARGHELGNHSCFHPCRQDKPTDHPWLHPPFNLADYTPRRWVEEMKTANMILTLLDGKKTRSFGNTCHNTSLGRDPNRVELSTLMPDLFIAGRGRQTSKIITPENLNWYELGCFGADGETLEKLKPQLEATRDAGGWIIYCLHGVGKIGAHNMLNMDEPEHRKLVDYLGENSKDYWTVPVAEAAAFLKGKGDATASPFSLT